MNATETTGGRAPARHSSDVKTLRHAASEFARKRSPWIIAAVIVLLVARVRSPARSAGRTRSPPRRCSSSIRSASGRSTSTCSTCARSSSAAGGSTRRPRRAHRAHHRKPNDLTIILLEPKDIAQLLFIAMPVSIALWAVPLSLITGSVPVGAIVTAALTTTVLIGIYEWTHFLIHTSHRPRSRYYRTIWRTHRLHHFKNEHYWHGITNTSPTAPWARSPTSARSSARRPRATSTPGSPASPRRTAAEPASASFTSSPSAPAPPSTRMRLSSKGSSGEARPGSVVTAPR